VLDYVGVKIPIQAVIFHEGFNTLPRFSGMEDSRAEMRAAIDSVFGLKASEGHAQRADVADILNAWEIARARLASEIVLKAEQSVLEVSATETYGTLADYILVRKGNKTAVKATQTISDPELQGLHFTTVFQMQAQMAPQVDRGEKRQQADGGGSGSSSKKSATKADSSKAKASDKDLKFKRPDGRSICFKYGRPGTKCDGECGMLHVCQRCFGPHKHTECKKP
jgi:hypothetical protein